VVKFLPEVVLAFLCAGLNSIENQIILPFLPNAPEEQGCTLSSCCNIIQIIYMEKGN